jgi:hypothetical protein
VPTLGLLDIDGSLVRNVYGDKRLTSDPALLDEVLAGLPPFPWVLQSGILSTMTAVKTVTGRQARQRQLTIRWFSDYLGICNVELIMVSYKTKEQYINDKESRIRQIVKQWFDDYGDDARVIFIEDDPDIIDFLREEFTRPNIQIVTVDSDGDPYGL